jgi:hypothetical protein
MSNRESTATHTIRTAILASGKYKSGDTMTASDVRSMTQGKYTLAECNNALAKMQQADVLERPAAGTYRRPSSADWLRRPWRLRTNEQLGIEA